MKIEVSAYEYEKIESDLLGIAFLIDGAAEILNKTIHPHSAKGLHLLSDIISLIAAKQAAILDPPE